MMKPRWIPFLISSAILFASRGEGYELHTHVRLSQHAFDAATALGFYLADLELTTNQAFDPDGKAKQSTAFDVSGCERKLDRAQPSRKEWIW